MVAQTIEQTQLIINQMVQRALDLTIIELLDYLESEIDLTVYGWESPSKRPWSPNRTYEFRDSWESTKAEIIGNLIYGEIYQNISVMKQSGQIHQDRDDLAEIIESGNGYNFGMAEGVSRPFFENFEQIVDQKLDSIFAKNCKLVGLDVKVGSVTHTMG